MKKLLIGLTLFCSAAVAADPTYYEAPMASGSKLTLTFNKTTQCNQYAGFVAYLRGASGKTLFGCWSLVNEEIMVVYQDGDVYTYPAGMFVGHGAADTKPKANPSYKSM